LDLVRQFARDDRRVISALGSGELKGYHDFHDA
jgi:hypothetical protein